MGFYKEQQFVLMILHVIAFLGLACLSFAAAVTNCPFLFGFMQVPAIINGYFLVKRFDNWNS